MPLRLCRHAARVHRLSASSSCITRSVSLSSKTLLPPRQQDATSSKSQSSTTQPPDIKEVLDILRSYERRYTYRGWHILRIASLAGAAVAGTVFYFWVPIRRFISREGSELAQQTMQDQGLQEEVDRITQKTTNTLLNDPETVQVTLNFLMKLLEKPETRAQVVSFFAKVLRDPVTIRQLQSSFNILLNDPTIRASLNDMVFQLLKDPDTQRVLESMVMDLLQRDNVKASTADFFSQVLKYPQVIDAATVSSKDVVSNLSSDEDVHKNLASAGSSAVKRMVIPGFFFRHPKHEHEHKAIEVESKNNSDGKALTDVTEDSGGGSIQNAESFVKDQSESNQLPAQ